MSGNPCVFSGCVCCYLGLDVKTCPPPTILCDGELRLICADASCCLKQGKDPFPVGLIKDSGNICKLGLYLVECSVFNPDPKDLIKLNCTSLT